jgi:hypothetical protein
MDILLSILLGLIQLGSAGLGVYVSLKPPPEKRHKWLITVFIILGLTGISINVITVIQDRRARNDLAYQLKAIKQTEEATSSDVKAALNKPEKRAILRFSLWPKPQGDKFINKIDAPVENGIVSVDFVVKNIGNAPASMALVWINICDKCKYAIEPEGSNKIPEMGDTVRVVHFQNLPAGTWFSQFNLKIIPPANFGTFTIDLNYGCEQCPPVNPHRFQKLLVHMIDSSSTVTIH